MSALFDDIRDACIADVDSVFAETVDLFPMLDGKADESRSKMEVYGVLRVERVSSQAGSSGDRAKWSQSIDGQAGELRVSRHRYPDLNLRKDDKIRAKEMAGKPWFRVTKISDFDHGRYIFVLVPA